MVGYTWDWLSRLTVVVTTTVTLMLGACGPLLTLRAGRPARIEALGRLAVLALPDACSWTVIAYYVLREPWTRGLVLTSWDIPVLRLAVVLLWLTGSAFLFPLAPAVVVLEPTASMMTSLRRASELARGLRALVVVTQVAPILLAVGALFQLAHRELHTLGGMPASDALTTAAAYALLVLALPLSGVLRVAGYRIAIAYNRVAQHHGQGEWWNRQTQET